MKNYEDVGELKSDIQAFSSGEMEDREAARGAVSDLVSLLESGEVRSAEKNDDGEWKANRWVKEGILLAFKVSDLEEFGDYKDKDLLPPQDTSSLDGVRVVPEGTAIRGGSHLEGNNIIMPPTYVNVGTYVGEGTMLDSHSLVGSCAQVGKDAHISGEIGGVLEPPNASPCIVEDEAFMGMYSSISESTVLREGAVLAPGVHITGGTRVYDRVNDNEITSEEKGYVEIPENAVLVPGSREIGNGYSIDSPIIAKYKDESTGASTALEEALR